MCPQTLGRIVELLHEEPFIQLYGQLSNWRIDPYIREMEAGRKKGRIFPFARGLRLSAGLIYIIREILEGKQLTANWGQLIIKQEFCSKECDIIIHHPGQFRRWNGNEKQVMDFRFIPQEKAVAVISCKSFLKSGDIDKEYSEKIKPFIKKVWLFAECCYPQGVKYIQKKAVKCGYQKFWYLYTWDREKSPEPNKKGWNEFVKEVKKLGNDDI